MTEGLSLCIRVHIYKLRDQILDTGSDVHRADPIAADHPGDPSVPATGIDTTRQHRRHPRCPA